MTKPLAQTVGRRKESVARVRLYDGEGTVKLNGKSLKEFFPVETNELLTAALHPRLRNGRPIGDFSEKTGDTCIDQL